jgi:hypothetical protein
MMNWSKRYIKESHFNDLTHPHPTTMEEFLRHVCTERGGSHHPEFDQFVDDLTERNPGTTREQQVQHMESNPILLDGFLRIHKEEHDENGGLGGSHPHRHDEQTNIEVPDTVDAISTVHA